MAAGRLRDALDTSANLSRIMGRIGQAWEPQVLARAGRINEARRAMADLERGEVDRYVGQLGFAFAHAALGETEAAVRRLERAFEERDPQLPFVKVLHLGPEWDRVLADAHVQALMKKMGLPK